MRAKLIDLLAAILSFVTRRFSFIPGMYAVTKPLHDFFSRHYTAHADRVWKVISLNGYLMKVNLSYRIAAMIYWRGAHEWAPIYLLGRILRSKMVVYDIGANIGEVSLFCAHRLEGTGMVYAFEPVDTMYDTLKENIALNKYDRTITAVHLALSDSEGAVEMYAANAVTELGLYEEGLNTLFPSDDRHTAIQKVKLSKLDSLNLDLPPDLMKIDVEGAELFVLKGAAKTIEKYHPEIIIEFCQTNCEAAGYDRGDILSFLKQFGYKFYSIENRGRLAELTDSSVLSDFINIYCV